MLKRLLWILGAGALLAAFTLPKLPLYHLPAEASYVPLYAVYSLFRMLAAYAISLVFALSVGFLAASSRRWEMLLLPILDVLQSVPVLGFFPAALYFFVTLTKGNPAGIEMASIFLIFTSMVWNMTFGVYESIKTIPLEYRDAVASFGANPVLRFSRLTFPSCIPKLIYNSMLSWANAWYFLIACEIIVVGSADYELPGLGSYLMKSVQVGNIGAMTFGLIVLIAIIILIDVLIWRPFVVWSQKYRFEEAASSLGYDRSLVLDLMRKMSWTRKMRGFFRRLWVRLFRQLMDGYAWISTRFPLRTNRIVRTAWSYTVWTSLILSIGWVFFYLAYLLILGWPDEARSIPAAMLSSLARVIVAYFLSLAWTLPVVLWINEHPKWLRVLTPIVQIGDSIPAVAFFPILVALFAGMHGGLNIAAILLMMTGMQWYLMFELLAGLGSIPQDLRELSASLGLPRRLYWKRVVIPAILPSLVTGSITAWGGGWNSIFVSEYLVFREQVYQVRGIGALLSRSFYEDGNPQMILLTLLMLVVMIVLVNRLFWHRMYQQVARRYKIEY